MAATWAVTAQIPTYMRSGSGQPVQGVEVHFTTGGGHEGSVFVSKDQYTPDRVRAIVAAEADNIDTIGALTSENG